MKFVYRVGLAVAAYFWATGLMDALFAYRSALGDQPPKPVVSGIAAVIGHRREQAA